MYGRNCAYLLTFSFLLASPLFLCGQSDRADAGNTAFSPQYSIPAPPRFIPREPIRPEPREPFPGPVVPRLPQPLPVRITFGLRQLARTAGIIFSGTVMTIEQHPAITAGEAVGTVAITFRVENAIRGTAAGRSLKISQWIGTWSAGQQFHVGERVLVFLYPPSKIGLTSCIAGGMGRFRVDSAGNVLLSTQQLSAFQTDPVLGGRSRVNLDDFAWAVRRATEEE
jgi:hypothetical protein